MTIVTASQKVCADREVSLPILARLPDLEPASSPAETDAPVEPDLESETVERSPDDASQAKDRQPRIQSKGSTKAHRIKRIKSQIAMVLVALAFVVLLAMLMLHRKPSNEKGEQETWPTVADDGIPSATGRPTVDVSTPKRLPPVEPLPSTANEPSQENSDQDESTPSGDMNAAQLGIALQGPSNAPTDGDGNDQDNLPGIARLTGTIEPDNTQAGNNQHSAGTYR